MVDSTVIAKCAKIRVNYDSFDENGKASLEIDEEEYKDLSFFDLCMNRLEPPVDENYLTQCKLLMFHPRVYNSPVTLQAYSEKFIPLYLNIGIATSVGLKTAPRDGVVKPLNNFGGTDVSLVKKDAPIKEAFMFQNFAPEIRDGEIRYLSLGSEVFGELKKVPKEGEFRANTFHGGTLSVQEMDPERRSHASQVASVMLRDMTVQFGAIDYIGKRVSEINITCPTAYFFVYCRSNKSEKERMDEAFKAICLK